MKSFEYAAPNTLKEATALLGDSWGKTEILAGGTDLITSLKQRVIQPERVVSLRNIEELHGVEIEQRGVRIRAMTTLAELAGNAKVKQHFPSLVTAIAGIGSPQIENMGTIGGDLCQRPRCWYFRNGFGLFGKQGDASLVRDGDNRYHAIFGNSGPALFVSPSSIGPALVALGASLSAVSSQGTRMITAGEFFRTPRSDDERETALKPNEILKDIFIPIQDLKNATYEVRHRHGLDWPYVTATVAMHVSGGKVADAKVVLGHVAPTPWSASAAAKELEGAQVDDRLAAKAGEAAAQGATPLSGNGYKVQMVKAAVKRAMLAAAVA
jgi:xanthine dehydrogenase YagS FAD-binding subunit